MQRIEEYFPRELLERYGADVAAAGAHAEAAVEEVIAHLMVLPEGELTAPVAPGKWTPLQVADHLHRVNLLAIAGLERVGLGEEPLYVEPGSIGEDGGLVVGLEGALPASDLELVKVVADLRSSTTALVEAAVAAEGAGLAGVTVNVNPFFGELTPLGSVQMAALHARHHLRRHLS